MIASLILFHLNEADFRCHLPSCHFRELLLRSKCCHLFICVDGCNATRHVSWQLLLTGTMKQRRLYICLSIAVSLVTLYTFYYHVECTEYCERASLLFNLHNASPDLITEPEEFVPGQTVYRVLANGTRVLDNLNDIHNETLGVSPTALGSPLD